MNIPFWSDQMQRMRCVLDIIQRKKNALSTWMFLNNIQQITFACYDMNCMVMGMADNISENYPAHVDRFREIVWQIENIEDNLASLFDLLDKQP